MAEDIKNLIFSQAEEIGVPPELALAVAEQETNFDQTRVGTSGEHGVYQLMEGTAADLRVNRDDLNENIRGGLTYLKQMYQQTGESWEDALKAYNGGIGNFKRDTVSSAAQGYAKSVLAKAEKYKTKGSSSETFDKMAGDLGEYEKYVNEPDTQTFDKMAGNLGEYEKYVDKPNTEQFDKMAGNLGEYENYLGDTGEEARAAPPAMKRKEPEINLNVPNTPQGLSQVLLQRLDAPDFYEMPFDQQAKAVSDIYKAKPWGKEAYPVFKEVMNNLWDGADPDQLPDIREIVGAPPISEKDPTKETEAWKTQVVQDLLAKGISPGVFGNKLDKYMSQASQEEIDAFAIRNQGFASRAASTVGNLTRDVVKGAASAVANPVAGVVRLGTGLVGEGASEAADTIQSLPELLGKPSNGYLYETDDNGYLKLDEKNQPIPRWQSNIAQTIGSVGSFLAGGVAAKAVGAGTKAISAGFFSANALTVGNEIFKDVYEKTGSTKDAYVGSLFALPAAAVGSMGEMAVVSKFANPVISALNPYNKVKYFANVFTRNAAVGAASNAGLNAIEQAGKISQTGEEFNTAELAQNAIAGGLISGAVGGALARPPTKQTPPPTIQTEAPPTVKGTTVEQQNAAKNLEKFQVSNAQELTVPNSEAVKIHPEVLDTLGMVATPNGNNTTITKRTSYVPFPVTEELTTLNKNIEELHYSLTKDGKPEDAFALSERLTSLKKEYGESAALLDDATRTAVQQRNSLDTQVRNARIVLDRQTDPTLREVSRLDLREARDRLDAFDAEHEFVYSELPLKVGELDAQIQETQSRLENSRRGLFPNDISAKQADLAAQIEKRKAVIAKIEAEQANAQPKPESEAKEVLPEQSKEEIIQDATPEVDAAEGVPVNGRNVIPVNGKWHALDKKGNPIGTGKDYYTDAVKEASGQKPVKATSAPKGELPPLPEEPSILSKLGGSVGAMKATNLFPLKTTERVLTSKETNPLVKQTIEQQGDTTYYRQTHKQSELYGSQFIEEHPTIEAATQAFLDLPQGPGAEHVFAARKLQDHYNKKAGELKAKGDLKGAEDAANMAMRVTEKASYITNPAGQIVDAAKVFAALSPDVVILNTNATAKEANLPGMTPEQEARVRVLMDGAKESGGTIQQNYLNEVARIEMEVTKGAFKNGTSALFTLWQGDQLSDPSTQGVNAIGNASQLLGSAASFLATGLPRGNFDGISLLKGYVKGATGEGFDAAMLELQGIPTFRPQVGKADTSSRGPAIGREDFVKNAPKWMQKIGLNNIGYVFRALSATDATFYKTAQEGMGNLVANNIAIKEGLTGNARKNRVAELLYNSKDEWNKANVQAKAEVASAKAAGVFKDKKFLPFLKSTSERLENLRTWEILDEKRPESIRNEQVRFASRNTFTNKPEGVAGSLVGAANKFASTPIKMPGGKEIRPFKYLFPFMNVAGNIANASLDYTPVGAFRAKYDSSLTNLEKRNAFGKFMLGSLLGGTVWGIANEYMDDKDPYFAIYGSGPKDPYQNKLWKESGAKPYSIKIGDKYFRYSETPVGILLGSIGAIMDAERYDKTYDRAGSGEALAILFSGGFKSFADNSFLKSIGTVVKAATGEADANVLDTLVVNPAKGFIPAAGALRAVSKMLENPIQTKNDFYAKMVSGVPFVQGIGTKPSLNAFGEPVERSWEDRLSAIGRFYSDRVTEPATRFLAEKGYTIPDFGVTVAGSKALKQKRAEALGAGYAEVLTPDERYELIQKAGPLIKERVLQYSNRYGSEAFSEDVQKRLTEDVKKIRSRVRKQIIVGSVDD